MEGLRFPAENLKTRSPNGMLSAEDKDQQEPIGIYLTDGGARTLTVNRSYEDITGIMEEEVQGRHMQSLVDDGYFDQSVTLLVLEQRMPISIEQTILRTGKKIIATGNPIFDYHGNIVLVMTTDTIPTGAVSLGGKHEEKEAGLNPLYFPAPPGVVANSKVMQQVLARAGRAAIFESTVLLQGETGVGKAVVADFVHRMSPRKNGPFINVNMAAIPENLLESELFGYKEGAFTGASRSGKVGLIKAAEGGTIFLDEISEISFSNQAKLLQLLQDKEITPIGSVNSQKVDVRFIVATNQNLQEMVLAGRFREDLFYRLNVAPIYIPPLRDRKEDIVSLAQYFLAEFTGRYKVRKYFSPGALRVLLDYNWPGNVRELQNMVERVVLLYPHREISEEHFFEELALQEVPLPIERISPAYRCNLQDEVAAFERDLLKKALKHYDGDLQKIAEMFEIHRTTLFRKMRKYGLG